MTDTTNSAAAVRKMVPVVDLEAASYNPREIGSAEFAALKASLRAFGMVQELVVNRGVDGQRMRVVGGHQRLLAAAELGWTEVPCVFVDLDDDHEMALNVALNSSKLQGTWTDSLAGLLASIHIADDLMDELRFEELALDLAAADGHAEPRFLSEPDDVPPETAAPVSRRGDVWTLGDHRLMCGDSTSRDDVAKLMDGTPAGIVFTSPPYAQQRDYGNPIEDWETLMRGVFDAMQVTDDAQLIVNLGMIHQQGEWIEYWRGWLDWMRTQGWRRFGWYVWDKISATFKANDGRLWMCHEWVFHLNKKTVPCIEWVRCIHAGEMRNEHGQRRPDGRVAPLATPGAIKARKPADSVARVAERFPFDVVGRCTECGTIVCADDSTKPADSVARIQRETNNSDADVRKHPARFPVSFAQHFLRSYPGDVYEPFSGSGSVLIAGETLGRRIRAMEIHPTYADIGARRWQNFTGNAARLEGDGRTFDELAAERAALDNTGPA